MAEALYLKESYLRECESGVVAVEGKFVFLERTIFYPVGGGQPCDTGRLVCGKREFKVVSVKKTERGIAHEMEGEGLRSGEKVRALIDWDRRYALMRCHTAAHVISGVVHHETGALITGNQLDVGRGRIDFDLEDFKREKVQEYIEKANDVIAQDIPIDVYDIKRDELEKYLDIFKLAKNFPSSIQEIRVVDIRGFDRQADGGTHVKSTKEVGKIELEGCENKGKNNRRLYFKVG